MVQHLSTTPAHHLRCDMLANATTNCSSTSTRPLQTRHNRRGHCRRGHCRQGHCRQGHCRQGHRRQGHCRQGHCRRGHCRQGHQQTRPLQTRPLQTRPLQTTQFTHILLHMPCGCTLSSGWMTETRQHSPSPLLHPDSCCWSPPLQMATSDQV